MSASSIELGAVFQADGDQNPIRVIAFDDDVVMYDAWWPHIQAWGMTKLTGTVFYYRLPRDWFDRRMRYLRTEEYTEKERSVHRPDLPLSFALHDSMSWYSQRPDSVSQLDVQLAFAAEQEGVVLGHLPAQAIYLASFGPQGTSRPTTLIPAQNGRSLTELEVLWHAWQLQAPYLRERQLTKGLGLHRLGIQRQKPSYYIWGSSSRLEESLRITS